MKIYLDYMANTPIDEIVLNEFNKTYTDFYANPNSLHDLGYLAKEEMDKCTQQILNMLDLQDYELIYTSGASESNNLATKGIARSYRQDGKHIISTYLEHSSLSASLTFLQTQGYEIELVNIDRNGRVDLEHLKELLRKDTVLVSISYVDSELGILQPIDEIKEILKDYPNCFFHTDATQAIGKTKLNFKDIDLITFTPHKFYGLNSSGVLIKKKEIILEPIINGGKSTTIYRSGTPDLPMAKAMLKALNLAISNFEKRLEIVSVINEKIRNAMEKYDLVTINSTKYSIPYTLNISVKGIKATFFQEELNKKGVYISTKSACDVKNTPSRAVFAVSKDRKNALSSFRLSFSHLTTLDEIEQFLLIFDEIYKKLT